jgi:hypothetical protein
MRQLCIIQSLIIPRISSLDLSSFDHKSLTLGLFIISPSLRLPHFIMFISKSPVSLKTLYLQLAFKLIHLGHECTTQYHF